MADKLYKVAGFTFTDEAGAKEALKEQKTIEYIESKTNMKDPKMINKVYHQIVDQNMFHTPVGFAYINKLKYLLEDIEDENADKRAVNSAVVKPKMSDNKISLGKSGKTDRTDRRLSGVRPTKKAKKDEAVGVTIPPSERTIEAFEERLKLAEKELTKYKNYCSILLGLAFVLLISVGAMFFINSTIGSPTILNYEQEIINKYAMWEHQLIEKENELIVRERALNNK